MSEPDSWVSVSGIMPNTEALRMILPANSHSCVFFLVCADVTLIRLETSHANLQ